MQLESELEKLVNQGYMTIQKTHEYIVQMEKLLEELDPDFSRSALFSDAAPENNENGEEEFDTPQPKRQLQRLNGKNRQPLRRRQEVGNLEEEEDQQSADPSNEDGSEIVECLEESKILSEYFKVNALRPVICAKPGRLPYRHDQHRKLEQYRKEWTANPAPGDKRRDDLRWQIRDEMNKRDIPSLKLVHKSQLKQQNTRKDWMP
uniref:Centriolar and ciliogenesis-associated protein HYLS1 C-terminal domain-containing protein n=1 Tax=Ditylenchus dipsaci TaxID=166011 RepID=A0A915E364_9BILA